MAKTLNAIISLTNSEFSIPVFERKRNLVNTQYRYGPKKYKTALKTNFWELSVATSLAYLSKKNTDVDYIESLSVMLRVINAFEVKDYKISTSGKHKNIIDFSRTSRMGELGQGFSYLLAQEYWGCKIILDLADFVKENNIAKASSNIKKINIKNKIKNKGNNRTADFIAFRGQGSLDAIVIESKAGYKLDENKEKSRITSALPQLNNYSGILLDSSKKMHANIQNSYAVCTSISDEGKESFVSYFDPESIEFKGGNIDKAIRKHYAKFFFVSGHAETAETLKENKNINNDQYISDDSGRFEGYTEISNNGLFKTHISKSALNFLTGKSTEIITKRLEQKEPYIASFSDGTIYELNYSLLNSISEEILFNELLKNF